MPAARNDYTGRFSSVPIKDRFLSFVLVNPVTHCWTWLGTASGTRGVLYGRFSVGPARTRIKAMAHVWAYKHWNGPIPEGMWVLHRCDNGTCVNPDHLFLGTHQDNEDDKSQKGRRPIGEQHALAKLTEKQVRDIMSDRRLHREIATDYGIHKSSVSHIKTKRGWRHLWAS